MSGCQKINNHYERNDWDAILASSILLLIKNYLYLMEPYCDSLSNKELAVLIVSHEHVSYSEAKERLNDFLVCMLVLRVCGLLDYKGKRQLCTSLKECSYKMDVSEIAKRLRLENFEGIWFRRCLLKRIRENVLAGKKDKDKCHLDIYLCALDLLAELYIAPDNQIHVKETGVQPHWDKDRTVMESVKRLWEHGRMPKDKFRWKYAIDKSDGKDCDILFEDDHFGVCGIDDQNFMYKTSLVPMHSITRFLNWTYCVSGTDIKYLKLVDMFVAKGSIPGFYEIRLSLTEDGKYIAGCLFDGIDMKEYYLDPAKRLLFYDWLCSSGNTIYAHADEFHDVAALSEKEIIRDGEIQTVSTNNIRNLIDTFTGRIINRYVFAGPVVPPAVYVEEEFFELFEHEHPKIKLRKKRIGKHYAYSWCVNTLEESGEQSCENDELCDPCDYVELDDLSVDNGDEEGWI